MSKLIHSLTQSERLNFLITNRIPRRLLTQLMGRYSKIESRLLTRLSVNIWRLFAADLDLTESKAPRILLPAHVMRLLVQLEGLNKARFIKLKAFPIT